MYLIYVCITFFMCLILSTVQSHVYFCVPHFSGLSLSTSVNILSGLLPKYVSDQFPFLYPLCALGHQMPDTCKYSLISWKHSYSPANHKAIFNKCKSIRLLIKILQQLPTVFKLLDGVSRLSTIWSHLVSCHSLLCTFLPSNAGLLTVPWVLHDPPLPPSLFY